MGYIYKISNTVTPRVYIGQTTLKLNERWNKHLTCARAYAKNPRGFPRGTCSKLYAAMAKYGIDNFRITIVTEIEDDDHIRFWLDCAETAYIRRYDSIKNGYNLRAGGNSSNHADETKKIISQRTREGINEKTIDNFRKNEQSMGAPKHIVYVKGPRFEGYRIHKHPLCKGYPTFTIKKYGSLPGALRAAEKRIAELEAKNQ